MKKYITLIIWLSGLFFAFSQEPTTKEKEINDFMDELFTEDQTINELIKSISTNYQFLYISTTYNSDTYFSGRDIGIDQYNITPQITYVNSNGVFANISGIYYSEFEPNWDYTSLTLGYGKSIDKKKLFRAHAAYSKYFYSDNGLDNLYTNALNLGISAKNKMRNLGAQLSGTYLFGEDQSFQITFKSHVIFKLLKTKNARLRFKPQLSIVAGKQTFELSQTIVQNGELITDYIQNDVFDLINTQISLPLQFNSNSFDFELGYNFNIPSEIGDESNLKTTGYFNLSIAYLIDL